MQVDNAQPDTVPLEEQAPPHLILPPSPAMLNEGTLSMEETEKEARFDHGPHSERPSDEPEQNKQDISGEHDPPTLEVDAPTEQREHTREELVGETQQQPDSAPEEPPSTLPDEVSSHQEALQHSRRSTRQRRPPLRYREAYTTSNEPVSIHGYILESEKQAVLGKLYRKYGNEQFTKGKAPDIPEWLYTSALEEEMSNWKGHYRVCQAGELQPGSNVIGSHFVYRIKQKDDSTYKFKARLVVHGNEDAEKDDIRKDAATAHLTMVRMLLSLAVCYGFGIGKIDIKAAYFQSGGIRRKIYVRPPREMLLARVLWELIALPYGIVEAGRQWQLASDDFLTSVGLTPLYLLPQGFMLRKQSGLQLIVAKVVDDFILAGTETALKWFSKKINARFQVGTEVYAPEPVRFNGAIIKQSKTGAIKLSMKEFADSIASLELSKMRRKQLEAPATEHELRSYQSLAGKMNWLGHSTVPQYAFAASYLQQCVGDLRVKHLVQANGVLKEMQRYPPLLIFDRPVRITQATLHTFADASFPKAGGSVYGQSGIICGLALGSSPEAAFHTLAWSSRKQTRVCRSSTAAEILAICDGEDLGSMIRGALHRVSSRKVPHHLNIDSRSLFEALATQHELRDFRLRQATQSLRASFEVGDISVLRWIAGKQNPSDALTKRSPATGELLSAMCSKGSLTLAPGEGSLERSSELSEKSSDSAPQLDAF